MKTGKSLRLIALLGAAAIGSACILETVAPNTTAQIVVVTATPNGAVSDTTPEVPDGLISPTLTQELTQLLTATFTPSLTPTNTIAPVTMVAGQALSCVKGPDWKLYEWVAAIADGETVTLVARAVPEIADYYVVRKSNGTECWAFGGSSAITGSPYGLPIRETPPLPTVNFTVRNHVNIALCTVYIRKAGDAAWGANRAAAMFGNGSELVVPITAGYYDVLVKDCGDSTMHEAYNRAIGSDDNYRILTVDPDVDFSIRNNYPFSVCHVRIRVAPTGAWEEFYNHDTSGSFAMGATKDFRWRAGAYNLEITRCTDVVLPALYGLYVRPGMSLITWS
jgi:hypothetical protein